jgi:radical S-adenosyl methionine domain-containing protein 2
MDLIVHLHLLKRCSYRCKHCFAHFDSGKTLSVDIWKAVIDTIALDRRVTRFNLAGGEPLLFPDLYELVEYIHQKGKERYRLSPMAVCSKKHCGWVQFP